MIIASIYLTVNLLKKQSIGVKKKCHFLFIHYVYNTVLCTLNVKYKPWTHDLNILLVFFLFFKTLRL